MQNLRSRLPPLNTLIAFEASARHGSFTRAAHELSVSREAVSRHIRILERHLGLTLFTRLHRAVELTAAGRRFHETVQRSLLDMAQAADALSGRDAQRLTVTATVAIASFWLTPRLPAFRSRYPQTRIHMAVSDAPRNLVADGIDLGLRYGDGDWPGCAAQHLFATETMPVCTPGYLETAPPIAEPADLRHHELLNLDGDNHAGEDWTWWFSNAGVSDAAAIRTHGFDNYANVVQATLDGQGIALGFSGIVDDLLADGRLVQPVAPRIASDRGVHLIWPKSATLAKPARQFRDWVIEEAEKTRAAMAA